MTRGAFIVGEQLRGAAGERIETIASLAGLWKTRPGMALGMAIFMFSLAGIPPLFGFYAKFAVFYAAVQAGLFPLAVVGIVLSVPSAYYYIRVVKTMYFDEPAGEYGPGDRLEGGLIALTAAMVSPLGYLAIPLLGGWTMAAAKALF